ncbi:MAG TPA: polysaccharide biosynthesis protein [Candidatus Gallacutalibacter stercoravium]|nr:polysaccharide biosynthesis protein [Candidatus Gallacutalibacter stercoravium]
MTKLYNSLKRCRKFILFFCDFVIWNVSFYCSFTIIRNNYSIRGFEDIFLKSFLLLNVCFCAIFLLFRLYDKIWRYADIEDFFYVGVAAVSANVLFYLVTKLFVGWLGDSLGGRTHVMLMLMSTFLLIAFRLLYRINKLFEMRSRSGKAKKRMLIVGAGEAAVSILHEIAKSSINEYLPVCIVDDDSAKVGRRIAGVKVEGSTADIPQLCQKEDIDVILFSISMIAPDQKKRILDICSQTNTEVKIIPNIYDLVTANVPISSQIRNVEVEDLLGREPVHFDNERYGRYLTGQTILITGGGGSIGSELCRQIAKLHPKKLIILDIYENSAYDIQQELLRSHHQSLNFAVEIASVRDYTKLEQLFQREQIDVVFHAAAHKHVPLMETNPEEAVKNNVFGTRNVARLADKYRVRKFVLISTDKAVNPTNVMGATKRICEMIVQDMSRHSGTEFVAVRFGNVLGSNGSVIPLFKQQIAAGGPVTVTHPDIIRYFMTIPEAVSLVLTAGGLARGGEIFVLDMGEPVKIRDLAENLIRLSGFVPEEEIPIVYTGLRPGEKLYEELLLDEEGIQKTENKKIYIGRPIQLDELELEKDLERLRECAKEGDSAALLRQLKKIVPTFHHQV